MAKHLGAFAGGFAKSLTEMMKLYLMQQHYDALNKHYAAQEELWANRGQGRGKGLTPEERAAGETAGRDWDRGGGSAGVGGWWTPERMQYATDRLEKEAGLTHAGAAGLVARWSGIEASGGPTSSNNIGGGHWGIGQWDAARGGHEMAKASFEDQVSHAIGELNGPEKIAGDALRSAKTPEDGARGASMYERAEHYDPKTGVDDHTARTPVKAVLNAIDGAKPAAKTEIAANVPSKAATPEEAETDAPGGGFRLPGQDPASVGAGPAVTPGTAIPRDLPSDQGPGPGAAPLPPGTTMIPGTMGPPQRPPGPEDPEIAARQAHGQGALPPPRMYHSLQPDDMPSSGVGVSGLPPPPARPVTPTPTGQMGPEGGGATTLPPEWSHMPSPGQVDPKGVYAPTAYARDTGARPDLTARSPDANKPSPNAQPVSATRAIPSNPQSNSPGYTLVDRPNADVVGRNSDPKMTAIDLSHLWGPNPPVADRAPAPPPPPPPRPQDQDFSVGSPNMDDAALGEQIMGSAKGGPIKRYASGGAIPTRPTMKLAGGGNPSTFGSGMGTAAQPAGQQIYAPTAGFSTLEQQMGTLIPQSGAFNIYGSPQNPADQTSLAAWNKLTPDQQTWYTGAQTALQQGLHQPSSMQDMLYKSIGAPPPGTPAAAAPAPAPAAPAPAPVAPTVTPVPVTQNPQYVDPVAITKIDPTTATVTGAQKIPDVITAKSYDPNVDAQTGAGFADTTNTGGTDYSVGSDDLLKTNSAGKISGTDPNDTTILSAKGGAIPSRPTMKFAGAGAVPAGVNPAYYGIIQGTYNGPVSGGGWMGTPQSQLAPNQQAWATGQTNTWNTIDQATAAHDSAGRLAAMNQLTMMPDAVWPTAAAPAPAAPAPAPVAPTVTPVPVTNNPQYVDPVAIAKIDPTVGTSTGAPQLPNTITAKSYDPNVDAQTGAGFADTSNTGGTDYSVGSDDLLKQNAQGQISGTGDTILSRKGGPITRRVTRYDDGGGVSPSAAGMPPGLGGQQAIPPIYYNPATYAAAGAPVGKGISTASAPTFGAGAIPSLPMARGGVVAFDDGGDVQMPDTALEDERGVAADDQMTNQMLAQNDAAPQPADYYTPTDYTTPAQGGAPAGVSPITPEISDGHGNPSRGLIGAIGDGLHWLGDHLGLVGGAQAAPAIASHPTTQTNRANFAQGQNVGGMDTQTHQQLGDMIDPNKSLDAAERQIAVMEGTYKYMLTENSPNAGRMAASILQYAVQTSQKFAEEAAKQLYDGNLKGAVDNINHASDAVPDGRLTHATLNPDGTITVQGKDMNGRVLWQQKGSAEAILQYATNRGRTGQMQWDALESQAAKYDPTFRDMAKARTENIKGQTKEDAATAESEREASAFKKMYPDQGGAAAPASAPPTTPALPGQGNKPAGTTITVSNAPPAPASAPSPAPNSGGTTPQTPPQTADNNPPPLTRGVTGHGGALPPPPNQANVPTADMQNADLERPEVETQNRNNIRQNIVGQFIDPKTRTWLPEIAQTAPPIPVHPSQIPEYATATPAGKRAIETQYTDGRKQYDAWQKSVTDEMNRQAVAADKNYTDDLVSRRAAALGQKQITSAETLEGNRRTDAATAEANRRADETTKQQTTWTHEEQKPLAPDDVNKRINPEHPATSYLASSPATAVYKSDGTLDENASAQALGKMFDLNDRGGLRRVDTLSTALTNTQTFNPHVGTQQLGTTLTNMANGAYGYRAKTQPVDYGYGPMRQVEVFRGKVGQGTPTRLLIPADDYDAVDGIKGEFVAAQPKPPANTATGPAAPSGSAIPRTPYRPLVQARPGEESGVRKPAWVPPEQIPPEQRSLYPELNQ